MVAHDSYGVPLRINELDLTRTSARLKWTITVGVEYSFEIAHKHFSDTYEVNTTNGTAYISDKYVKYTPSVIGNGGFWLNGTFHPVIVVKNQPIQPSITSPVVDTLLPNATVAIASSAFVTEDVTVTHTSSRWQVATDPDFINIVMDTTSATALTGITSTGLSRGKTYYVRVMHIGTKP